MRLLHYQAKEITLDDRVYAQPNQLSTYNKPRGFWVSVEGPDDWRSWCISEGFREDTLGVAHEVTLADGANILFLESEDDLEAFEEEYGGQDHVIPQLSYIAIDWARVSEDYDGIIIAPYQWGSRLSRMWYYTWDAASGCIWNLDAIASVTPTPTLAIEAG